MTSSPGPRSTAVDLVADQFFAKYGSCFASEPIPDGALIDVNGTSGTVTLRE